VSPDRADAALPRSLGELETAVMDLLWSWDRPTTVRDVVHRLRQDRTIAYTTVMTVMGNLHRKGFVARQGAGRAYVYRPVTSREAYAAQLMHDVLAGSGDRAAVFAHFVEHISGGESEALRVALAGRGERR
jgi:predicted transcriptional regulator